MNNARPLRPTPGPTATMFHNARMALSDAQHAGDPARAARILSACAWELVRYDRLWTEQRPPLGVRRSVRDEAA